MSQKTYFVYILLSINNIILYIGVTNNLNRRVYEHKSCLISGFTKQYNVKKLVYYEIFRDINAAISREKQLKRWHRDWKFNLIKSKNPELLDLADELGNVTSFLMLDPEINSG
jgi:putative endonuclease